jgi:hypothetical protein
MASREKVGSTLQFVAARGFEAAGRFTALIAGDGTRRLLAELTADPDRPDVRPAEAYSALFASLQPGWTMRVLQVFMPDEEPRAAFLQRVEGWDNRRTDGLTILHRGLILAVQQAPLPFQRRTLLEYVLPGAEGLAWWEGLPGLLAAHGVQARWLDAPEITAFARRILNPGG